MRPKRYPYLKQRYVETIVSEVVIPYSSTSFGILGVLDKINNKRRCKRDFARKGHGRKELLKFGLAKKTKRPIWTRSETRK